MDAPKATPVAHCYIELRPTRIGGQKAYIVGTRISVLNVYVCHELQGQTPDEIMSSYPHLTLPQIHAALAYFYEHAEEIRGQLRREEAFADGLAAEQGPTRLSKVRSQLVDGGDEGGDPLSSG